jgi:hypothetical protein
MEGHMQDLAPQTAERFVLADYFQFGLNNTFYSQKLTLFA